MTPGRIPATEIDPRLRWAAAALRARGLSVDGPMQPIHKAWSVIVPIRTGEGAVFLKYVRGAFRHEPGLTRALHALAPDYVPEVLAENADLGCWVVRDAGNDIDLRAALRDGLLRDLLSRHSALQRQTESAPERWLARGAKNLRIARWPGYLEDIRAARAALDADKVTQEVVNGLARAGPALERLCAQLETLAPPETLAHMDLRRINVLERRGRVAVIDWGDAGLGPAFLDPVPLFSEIATLNLPQAESRALVDAAVAPWTDRAAAPALHAARRLCRVAYPLLYAHGLIHARPTADPTLPPTYHGLLQFYLATFLTRLSDSADERGQAVDSYR
ncbi:phosphotransferase [Psychromarinibacter sp. C21-152]|uniref:Phosphotransferase n=1 Tax=Psychromarinibacter sediminicola TaxID=3033385 RepID=A0AAE3NRS5_9RHOB|nr:phosphotransferase [Psychromarinibacter sediminicola]MDF0600826.1 phosphotransferase [Psychromarinibacter sediminicola]